MNIGRKLATFAAVAALVLTASTPNAQAETAYNVEFAGRITISTVNGQGLYYPTLVPGSKSTRTITSLTTTACVADFASAKKTPGQGVGTCTVTLVSGTIGASAITGQGPWCGNSGGNVVVNVTITDAVTGATKTVRASLDYESAGSGLVFDPLTSTVTKGNQAGPAGGTGTAVPDATTGHSCAPTGNGASAFLITASVSGVGLGTK